MAHRVVQLDSDVVDTVTADDMQVSIQNHVNSSDYSIHKQAVNDGMSMDGEATLGVHIDFSIATDANNFFDWLKQFIKDSSSDFSRARLRIHDCMHASDENKSCKIGNVWEL